MYVCICVCTMCVCPTYAWFFIAMRAKDWKFSKDIDSPVYTMCAILRKTYSRLAKRIRTKPNLLRHTFIKSPPWSHNQNTYIECSYSFLLLLLSLSLSLLSSVVLELPSWINIPRSNFLIMLASGLPSYQESPGNRSSSPGNFIDIRNAGK